MIIFVHGPDTFRSRAKLRELLDAFQKKYDPSGMNIARFDGKTVEIGDIMSAATASPFLAERRLIVVEGPFDAQDLFVRVPETTILILWDEKAPVVKSKKGIVEYKFDELKGAALTEWVKGEFKKTGVTVEPRATDVLIAAVGSDLWRLSVEIAKLAAHAGANGSVLARDVELLVTSSVESNIFGLTDALADRNAAAAFSLLERELDAGTHELQIMTMLTRQVRLLLQTHALLEEHPRATAETVAKTLGMHPFVAHKTLGQVRRFDRPTLERAYDHLFNLDWHLKTGRATPRTALDLFVASFVQK